MKFNIFLVGNFLSHTTGNTSVCEEMADLLSAQGYKVIISSHHRNRIIRMLDLILTAIISRNEYQIAVVDVFSYLGFLKVEILSLVLRWLKKPYILVLHGGMLLEFAEKFPKRSQRLINSALHVTTPSMYLQHGLKQIRKDIKYIPNGLYLSNYPFWVRNKPAPRLVWMRSYNHVYNPLLAVQVLKILEQNFPDIRLEMIGPDNNDGSLVKLKQFIVKNQLIDKVIFHGAVTKNLVGKYLSQGDIFINTTNYESFGVSSMEAAACGLCIVTTNAGELSYLWQDQSDALLVPIKNPNAMASAVRRVLTEPGLAEKLSSNARLKAEQHDWSFIFPQWEQLFSELLADKAS